MKKKLFWSFKVKGSFKERWGAALKDPGYWILWGVFLVLVIIAVVR